MKLLKLFSEYTKNWNEKLNKDEWFFSKFSDSVLADLSPEAAFKLIPEAVELVLAQKDEHLCIEAFELLFSLTRKSDTTEIPPALNSNWDKLMAHVSSFGEYHRTQVKEFSRWYRRQ